VERFGSLVKVKEDEPGPSGEKHAPAIEAPDRVSPGEKFQVRIIVGREVPHPNTVEHHIKWIQVFVREEGRPPVHAVTVDLGPVVGEPDAAITLKLERSATIHALAYCNLHGVWESSKRIEVA